MKNRAIALVLVGGLAIALGLLPQNAAQAKGTCYDQYKQPIPCPKSNYQLTQQAKPNISPSQTPVPATDTPTVTPTGTSSPTPTDTPIPTQAAALIAPPAAPSLTVATAATPLPAPPRAGNGVPLFAWLLGGVGLLAGVWMGIVRPTIRRRFIGLRPDLLDMTANADSEQDDYPLPGLHSHNHARIHEEITTRPEGHDPE